MVTSPVEESMVCFVGCRRAFLGLEDPPVSSMSIPSSTLVIFFRGDIRVETLTVTAAVLTVVAGVSALRLRFFGRGTTEVAASSNDSSACDSADDKDVELSSGEIGFTRKDRVRRWRLGERSSATLAVSRAIRDVRITGSRNTLSKLIVSGVVKN